MLDLARATKRDESQGPFHPIAEAVIPCATLILYPPPPTFLQRVWANKGPLSAGALVLMLLTIALAWLRAFWIATREPYRRFEHHDLNEEVVSQVAAPYRGGSGA